MTSDKNDSDELMSNDRRLDSIRIVKKYRLFYVAFWVFVVLLILSVLNDYINSRQLISESEFMVMGIIVILVTIFEILKSKGEKKMLEQLSGKNEKEATADAFLETQKDILAEYHKVFEMQTKAAELIQELRKDCSSKD